MVIRPFSHFHKQGAAERFSTITALQKEEGE